LLPLGQSHYMDAMATVAQAEMVTDIIAETRATDPAEVATRRTSPCCACSARPP
jgi:hypothetical protein